MDGVLASSAELNKRLLESETYMNYVATKDELSKFPKYKGMVDNFRKKQVEHEARKINEGTVDLNEEFALCNEYADICLITECSNFFYAETRLLGLLKSIYEQICENLMIDMDFMV